MQCPLPPPPPLVNGNIKDYDYYYNKYAMLWMRRDNIGEHVERVRVNVALVQPGGGRRERLIDDEIYGVDQGRRGERMTHTV